MCIINFDRKRMFSCFVRPVSSFNAEDLPWEIRSVRKRAIRSTRTDFHGERMNKIVSLMLPNLYAVGAPPPPLPQRILSSIRLASELSIFVTKLAAIENRGATIDEAALASSN